MFHNIIFLLLCKLKHIVGVSYSNEGRSKKIQEMYGNSKDNWGDLDNFQGNYINFGAIDIY